MTKLVAAKVDAFVHPPGSADGTLTLQVSWMRLDGPGQGKLTVTLVATPDMLQDLREAVAAATGIAERRVLILGA